jgi:hypothetical protein
MLGNWQLNGGVKVEIGSRWSKSVERREGARTKDLFFDGKAAHGHGV